VVQNTDTSSRPNIRVQSVNVDQVEKQVKWMTDLISDSIQQFLSHLEGHKLDAPSMGSSIVNQWIDGNLWYGNGNQLWVTRVNLEDVEGITYRTVTLDSCAQIVADEDCAKDESSALKP
jgi:hypothetical protein